LTHKLKGNNVFEEENFLIEAKLEIILTGVSVCKTSVNSFAETKGTAPRPSILNEMLDGFSSVIARKCQDMFLK
jgi:hypothetical protein